MDAGLLWRTLLLPSRASRGVRVEPVTWQLSAPPRGRIPFLSTFLAGVFEHYNNSCCRVETDTRVLVVAQRSAVVLSL